MEKHIKYVPLSLFCIAVAKALIVGAGLTDLGTILILGLAAGFYELKFQNKAIQVMHARCDTVDAHLTNLFKKEMELRSQIQTITLPQQMRSMSGRP